MCVSCGRMFHTSHLAYKMQDQLEKELYVCKLCSDPDLVTQHNPHCDMQVEEQEKFPQRSSTKTQPPNPATGTRKMTGGGSISSTSRGKQLLQDDITLPTGWYRQLVRNSVKRWRVVIIGPDERKFWSKNDVKRAFPSEGKKGIKWSEFDFTLSGSMG